MQHNGYHPAVGIDDLSAYLPDLYLPISDLATVRQLEYAKLNQGLGLTAMSVPDAMEDVATMAANAVLDLLHKNDINPSEIGRLYLGTESGVDGAKPTATYVLDMLQHHFEVEHGPHCFLNCDVVDITFACIGAVDALHNTLDWVRAGQGRIGIVVASDIAKYELGSGGEYTQGAGAVALLVRENPRLLTIHDDWGVAARSEHDFFKPRRRVSKADLLRELAQLSGLSDDIDIDTLLTRLHDSIEVKGVLDCNDAQLHLYRDTPVFDGPYSSECYQSRLYEALEDYRAKTNRAPRTAVTHEWERLVFHLPYAYQARRMFTEVYMDELKSKGEWVAFVEKNDLAEPCSGDYADREEYVKMCAHFLRSVSKTPAYQQFVQAKIEPGERVSTQVGNVYTGAIFLSLMSTLEADLTEGNDLTGRTIGFFAYGSGSKSKVFTGTVQAGWRERAQQFKLMRRLSYRRAIDYATYEQLHRGQLTTNVASQVGSFFLADVHNERDELEGARTYGYRAEEIGATV